jgi:hypothetical protein
MGRKVLGRGVRGVVGIKDLEMGDCLVWEELWRFFALFYLIYLVYLYLRYIFRFPLDIFS